MKGCNYIIISDWESGVTDSKELDEQEVSEFFNFLKSEVK